MKKVFGLFVLAALAAAAVSGCTPAAPDTPPDITGLIYSIEGDSFLVVEGIDNADIPYDEWFENGHNAIVFTVKSKTVLLMDGKKISFDQLKTGQNVQIWSTGPLADSYPMQGTAKRVVVTEQAAPPEITGLIYSIEDDRILVVEGIDTADIAYEEWFDTGNNAVVFTIDRDSVLQKDGKKIAFEQLEKGQKVQVWSTGGLMKSYPLQGTAKQVIVIEID